MLVSVLNNGVYQIITTEGVGTRLDGIPSSFSIYSMGDGAPYDASAKYRDWYRKHIYPELKEQLKGMTVGGRPDPTLVPILAYYRAAAIYALDEYRERVMGIKDARIDHALQWANAPDEDIRSLAVSAVECARESKQVDTVLDVLEASNSEWNRDGALRIRRERAERLRRKEGCQ